MNRDYGFLLDDMLCDADLPISLSRMLQPKIEAEIAFVLKKPLSGPGGYGFLRFFRPLKE